MSLSSQVDRSLRAVITLLQYRRFREAESSIEDLHSSLPAPAPPAVVAMLARVLCVRHRREEAVSHIVSLLGVPPVDPEQVVKRFPMEDDSKDIMNVFCNILYVLERCVYPGLGGHDGEHRHTLQRLLQARYQQSPSSVRGEQLFEESIRIGDFKAAQETANKLHRSFAIKKYRVWAVEAMLGQLPPDADPSGVPLQLIQRMLDGVLQSADEAATLHSPTRSTPPADGADCGSTLTSTPSMALTYLNVLERQGSAQLAIQFLCGPRGCLVGHPDKRLEVLVKLLQQQPKYRGVCNVIAQELWTRDVNHWGYFETFISTLPPSEPHEEEEGVPEIRVLGVGPRQLREGRRVAATPTCADIKLYDATTETVFKAKEAGQSISFAVAFCRMLQQGGNASASPQRGPFMAELSLLHRQAMGPHSSEADRTALEAATVAYGKRFYGKPCCILDLNTTLTPSSAAALYQWGLEAKQQQKSEDPSADLATRYLLGLRCYVTLWECSSSPVVVNGLSFNPSVEEMTTLMDECIAQFKATAPLSASLLWSEEGLHDGFLLCAANIALHAWLPYAAAEGQTAATTPPPPAVTRLLAVALSLLADAPRSENNPSCLVLRCCLAACLRLTDLTAMHQLSLQSVQVDTMAALGFWAALPGLSLQSSSSEDDSSGGHPDTVRDGSAAAWCQAAAYYFEKLPEEVGQAKAKAARFCSWSSMTSILGFERKQEHSLERLSNAANSALMGLLASQTTKSVMELLKTRQPKVLAAYRTLLRFSSEDGLVDGGRACGTVIDNADLMVVKATLLAPFTSSGKMDRLLSAALPYLPSLASRLHGPLPALSPPRTPQWGLLPLCQTLLLMADLATAVQSDSTKPEKDAKKNKKAKGKHQDANAAVPTVPTLWCCGAEKGTFFSQGCLPLIADIAPVLSAWLTAGSNGGTVAFSTKNLTSSSLSTEQMKASVEALEASLLSAVGTSSSAAAAESTISIYGGALLALLRLLRNYRASLPIRDWAAALVAALQQVAQQVESGTWRVSELSSSFAEEEESGSVQYVDRLVNEKKSRVMSMLSDMLADASAIAK